MLVGSADIDALASRAPTLEAYPVEPLVLSDVTLFQMVLEMRNGAREAVLPASLHPTIPPTLSIQVWDVREGPWGSFRAAVARVSCRAGVRARGFTTAAWVTTEAAAAGLADTYGYPCRVGVLTFQHGYAGAEVSVSDGNGTVFAARAIDPEPLGADDVQYTGTLNLAQTPVGLRLLQVEFGVAARTSERLRARLDAFESSAWGDGRLDPYHVVTASLARAEVTFAPIRFVLRPDELAFTGTEPVAAEGG